MKATLMLHDLGQSLWLDDITRDLLDGGTLKRDTDELSVTMPEGTLRALADRGDLGAILPADGGDGEGVLAQFAKAGVDIDALAAQPQDEGATSFVKSWHELMEGIVSKSADLGKAGEAP